MFTTRRSDKMRTVGYIPKSSKSVSPFVCPVCGREYKRESDFLKHIEKEHPEYELPSGDDE